ncbi:hypothetical protein RQ658_00865, partial [Streptococcus pneumoniae]|nr:hypothetical protein [Streptococcus pneumoniae]
GDRLVFRAMDEKVEGRLQLLDTAHMVTVVVSDQYISEHPTRMLSQPGLNWPGITWIYDCTGLV